jgi:proline iminopeptidase
VAVHGGPGSGCTPGWRRFFDPATYRIVLFDQRGCGRSTPDAGDPSTDLSTNTTPHLIVDMELLRSRLGIERWLLFGGSWGSTLGLAYAERHPERVSEIVLVAITCGRRRDIDWITHDVGRIFPEQWARFREAVPATLRGQAGGRVLPATDRSGPGRPGEGGPGLVRLGRRPRELGAGPPAQHTLRRPSVPDDLRAAGHPLLEP